jgi:hypothetical protein
MDLKSMGSVGCDVSVSCSLIGLFCVAQSCCVIAVFRVAYCTFNVSVVGSLIIVITQGVDTENINQSIIQTINVDFTFLSNVPSKRSYKLRRSPSQWVLLKISQQII